MILAFIFSSIFSPKVSSQQESKEEEALFVAKKAFDDGFYEVSLSLLERFLNNYPSSLKAIEANLLIGRSYFHANKLLEALKKFEELLTQPQANGIKDEIFYWIAEVHFRTNNFEKAKNYYQRIIEEFPKSTYVGAAYYSLGWCLFQMRNFQGALDNFKIVEDKFSQQPQGQDATFKIIECFYNLKDYNGLKERIKSYLNVNPKDSSKLPYLYFYLAEANFYLNSFDEASEFYSKVILGTADLNMQAVSRLGLGWSYLKLKRYSDALNVFSDIKNEFLEKKSFDILLLGKAILAQETNKLLEAKNIYDELIKTTEEPSVLIQAYVGKGDTLYSLSQYDQAIQSYKEARDRVQPESVPKEIIDKLHYGLAWAYLKGGEFKEAIDEFQKLVKESQDNIVKISALCQIGDAYQDSGDYPKAQEIYDSILKDYPESSYSDYVQYQMGLTLLKALNYDGAILSFLTLNKNFPRSTLLDDATYALGLAYFQKQDYNASREVLNGFAEKFKDSTNLKSQAAYLLGSSLYNLGKYAEAIEVFRGIIKMYGQDTELMQKAEYEIADCYFQMGNEKEAMARFKMLRAKYPDSKLTAEIIWWLGEYYYRHNDLDLSRRYFYSLVQDFSESNLVPDAFYALGTIYAEESNFTEALNNFKKVMGLSRSDLMGQAAIAIADIYVKDNKIDQAVLTYEEILKKYPNLNLLIYPKLADTYVKSGELNKALDYYRRSLEVVPLLEMADIQFKIAEVLQAQGKNMESVQEYLKVNYLYAQSSDLTVKALLRVAKIYEGKEDFKGALNIYQKIISLNVPEAKYARERIDQIKKMLR